MKSINGITIKPGQYMVYATSVGDSAALKYGRIIALKKIKPHHSPNSSASICFFHAQWTSGSAGGTNIELYNRVMVISKALIPWRIRLKLDEAYERKTADKRSVPRRGVRARRA